MSRKSALEPTRFKGPVRLAALTFALIVCHGPSSAQSPGGAANARGANAIPFEDYVDRYCHKFGQADENNLDMLFDEMEESPYPDVYVYLSVPYCQPRGYGNDVKMPAIQIIADDPVTRLKFLGITKTYFDFIKKPQLLRLALNAKSVPKNETFLDYLETMDLKSYYRSPVLQAAKRELVQFACANGAVYNVYKDKRCPAR